MIQFSQLKARLTCPSVQAEDTALILALSEHHAERPEKMFVV